jgi:hypothetical protein
MARNCILKGMFCGSYIITAKRKEEMNIKESTKIPQPIRTTTIKHKIKTK